jgi:hypothetical protein
MTAGGRRAQISPLGARPDCSCREGIHLLGEALGAKATHRFNLVAMSEFNDAGQDAGSPTDVTYFAPRQIKPSQSGLKEPIQPIGLEFHPIVEDQKRTAHPGGAAILFPQPPIAQIPQSERPPTHDRPEFRAKRSCHAQGIR